MQCVTQEFEIQNHVRAPLILSFYYSQWSICCRQEQGHKLNRMSKHKMYCSLMPIHRV